ncbi:FAD binding domain protein [Aspergillus pseudodeflectus]|uniref:FAD binding domain protein n=1 Tax=Aspergillus pseudodeflectus TaxID=176178 RepID=A0ABR4K7J2_9EURO
MANAQQIKTQLNIQGAILGPGDENYEEGLRLWSDTCYRRAAVVVHPKNANDIATTVNYAREHHLDLAVRGGGHSTLATSSTDGGILINLGNEMTRVVVDPDTRTVTVQGGATWEDVSREVGRYPLAVNGGTVSMVGVGGLSLEGGYGYYAPQHGVTLDTILAAKVVTGTGEIVSVSREGEEHADLFWAIRGAAPTVGVVYELTLQAYPQPTPIWYGMRSYPASEVQRVTEGLNTALFHPRGKAAAQCLLYLSPEDGKTPIVSTVLFFDGSEEEARAHFAPLLKLECIDDNMSMRPFSETNTVLDPFVPAGGRKNELGFDTTLPPRPEFVAELLDYLTASLTAEPDFAHGSVEIDFFDPTQICRVPVPDAAFPTRVWLLHGTAMLQWTDATKDEASLSLGKEILKMAERELLRHGQRQSLTVSNFSGYNPETKLSPSEMFGENARRLLDVKAKYDPANMFNKQNPIV